ncbi:DUF2799 domain-containing protein [Budvicia aquatica]|uniref:DUF2799 domain-containing protein n=1 Tax=Budvicia aquatica TaxID=82979 RepID=A0A2C6DSZ7_9GAMM|nr:DUF2799 domain-containing protein [Budvicia aquatica]PHI31931.1 DUF2799 domain-containing protein [Budvicia aquatica]GKX51290.1 lipoprotein [Budvicia aquatica]
MKYALVLTLALILTACSSSSSHQVENTDSAVPQSKWFDIGYNEALGGNGVKENTTLAEWYGEAEINRSAYLQGYAKGQQDFCLPDNITAFANSGKDFPASCNSVADSAQLKHQWQQVMDK